MKSREISQSKIGPFSLACIDPFIGTGWEYQSNFSDPKRWKRCALPSLKKKVPFLIVVQASVPSWLTSAPTPGHPPGCYDIMSATFVHP